MVNEAPLEFLAFQVLNGAFYEFVIVQCLLDASPRFDARSLNWGVELIKTSKSTNTGPRSAARFENFFAIYVLKTFI